MELEREIYMFGMHVPFLSLDAQLPYLVLNN